MFGVASGFVGSMIGLKSERCFAVSGAVFFALLVVQNFSARDGGVQVNKCFLKVAQLWLETKFNEIVRLKFESSRMFQKHNCDVVRFVENDRTNI